MAKAPKSVFFSLLDSEMKKKEEEEEEDEEEEEEEEREEETKKIQTPFATWVLSSTTESRFLKLVLFV